MAKKKATKKATPRKRSARRQTDDEIRALYAKLPQRHIAALTKRQTKSLQDLKNNWGLDIDGKETDLAVVLPQMLEVFRYLGKRHKTLGDLIRGETVDGDQDWEALLTKEKYLRQKALRQRDEGKLVDRATIHNQLMRYASSIRQIGDRLGKQFGDEAQQLLNEGIEEIIKELDGGE